MGTYAEVTGLVGMGTLAIVWRLARRSILEKFLVLDAPEDSNTPLRHTRWRQTMT